jgi:membrane fusion protein (multidrug efflux system)
MKIFLMLILVTALGVGYYLSQQETAPVNDERAPPPAPVTVWELQPEKFQSQVNALGTLQAWESVIITASVSEVVDKLYFDGGETVDKGTLLVNLQQDEERAGLRQQQEVLKEHEREVTRLENSGTSLIQTDLDRRRTLAAIARNGIDQEKARLADRNITAPFAGVLGLRQVSRGALVAPGQVITTLDDVSRMRLDFTVPAKFLRTLEPGQVIEAKSAAYVEAFTGVLAAVDSRVDPVNRSITARASFDNAEGLLKPGLSKPWSLSKVARAVIERLTGSTRLSTAASTPVKDST